MPFELPNTIYIILDINGTLLDRGEPSSASKVLASCQAEPQITVHSRPCYFRPFLAEWLDYLFQQAHHDVCRVGVWTSLRPENVVPIVQAIFGRYFSDKFCIESRLDQEPRFGPDESLFMIWSQRKCIMRNHSPGLDSPDWKKSKPIMIKNLDLLWPALAPLPGPESEGTGQRTAERASPAPLYRDKADIGILMDQVRRLAVGPCSSVRWLGESDVTQHGLLPKPKQLPAAGMVRAGRLTARNTLIIEDSPFKCGLQQENGLFIPSYQVQYHQGEMILLGLICYLKDLFAACGHSREFDIRDYLKQHPFEYSQPPS